MKFTIIPKSLEDDDVTVTFSPESSYYTGQPITPDVTVKFGNIDLVRDRDYTLEWEDNTDAGTATVSVKAYSDNYTDTKTAEFTILAAPASGKVTITGADNKVGTELTASVTGNTHILAYQWYCNGVEIAGATNKTYTLAAVDAGTQISVKVTSSGNYEGVLESGPITVYKPPQVTTYATAVEQTENGTVTVSPKNVSQGSTVTLTVTPDEGYELDTLTVTDKNGSEMKLTPQDNGKYTFTMPAGGVDVEAAFNCTGSELCSSHGLTDTLVKAWYHDAVDYVVEQGNYDRHQRHHFRAQRYSEPCHGGTDSLQPGGKTRRDRDEHLHRRGRPLGLGSHCLGSGDRRGQRLREQHLPAQQGREPGGAGADALQLRTV